MIARSSSLLTSLLPTSRLLTSKLTASRSSASSVVSASLLLVIGTAMLLPEPAAAQLRIDHIRRKQATGGIYAPGGAVSSLPPVAGPAIQPYGYGRRGGYGVSGNFGRFGFGFGGFRSYGGAYLGTPYLPPVLPYSPFVAVPPVAVPPVAVPLDPYNGLPLGGVGYGDPYAAPLTPLPLDPALTQPQIQPGTPARLTPLNSPEEVQRLKDQITRSGPYDSVVPRDLRSQLEVPPAPSTPDQQVRSLEDEELGDRYLAERNYIRAYARYKQAVQNAPDLPQPRLKMVVALAAQGNYDKAVNELDRLLRFSPEIGREFIALDQIFRDDPIAKDQLKDRVASWTAELPGNPARLFLLGGLMYFDTDIDRAQQLLARVEEFAPGRYTTGPLLSTPPVTPLADLPPVEIGEPGGVGLTVVGRPTDGSEDDSVIESGDAPILPTEPIEPPATNPLPMLAPSNDGPTLP